MKKKILYIAAIVICLSIITSGTLAYFTAEDTARNVITAGGVEISLVEQQMVNGALQPYPNAPIEVMPATSVSKIVSVCNREEQSFIRAKLQVTMVDEAGNEQKIAPETLAKIIHFDMNTDHWTQKDGWWYYGDAVNTDKVTEPLMTGLSFDGPNMTNEYQNCTVPIDVIAQAVQTANNGKSVMEAIGWPEET